jgi:hypothetical protein
VVLRRTLELADPDIPGSKQPYHAGESLELAQAERIVDLCRGRTDELALVAMRMLLAELEKSDCRVVGCAVLTGSERPPGSVAEVLASHTWMHAAEGQFFRTALVRAATAVGLRLSRLPEKTAYSAAAARLELSADQLEVALAHMGRHAGPPWRQDQKLAALGGWVGLLT